MPPIFERSSKVDAILYNGHRDYIKRKGTLSDAFKVAPTAWEAVYIFHVMLCGRGLGTTHIHRPLMAYVLGAKVV